MEADSKGGEKKTIFCYGSWTLERQNGSVALQRFGSVKQYFYVFQIQIIISVLNHCRSAFSWGGAGSQPNVSESSDLH